LRLDAFCRDVVEARRLRPDDFYRGISLAKREVFALESQKRQTQNSPWHPQNLLARYPCAPTLDTPDREMSLLSVRRAPRYIINTGDSVLCWLSGMSTYFAFKKLQHLRMQKTLTIVGTLIMSICSAIQAPTPAAQPEEFNTDLMQATFKIEGRDERGQVVLATGFLMGRPYEKDPKKGKFVLITAAHVLEDMKGDTVILNSRRKLDNDRWERVPFAVTIRSNSRPLYLRLPDADVAVMYIRLPDGVRPPLLSTEILADDDMLKKFEIHPGDEVRCLGYPLGFEANDAGFPILRSGKIASFPLTPTDITKTFLFDFKVFKGNSGGPVYFIETSRPYGGNTYIGQEVHFIIGLVSQEDVATQRISSPYSDEIRQLQLDLGVIVHASQIKKAINLLPVPDSLPE